MTSQDATIKRRAKPNLAYIALQSIYQKKFDRVDNVRKHPLIHDIGAKAINKAAENIYGVLSDYIHALKGEIFQQNRFLKLSKEEVNPRDAVSLAKPGEVESKLQKILKDYLNQAVQNGLEGAWLQKGASTVDVNWDGWMKDAREFLDNYSVTLSDYLTSQAAFELTTTIQTGLLQGKGAEAIASMIEDLDSSYEGRSMKIARTEGMRAMNQGRISALSEMGFEEYVWIASDLACPECAPLDGKIFTLDELPDLPKHPMCRCTTAAKTRFTKVGEDGKVIWD